jgi:hypothetical protein
MLILRQTASARLVLSFDDPFLAARAPSRAIPRARLSTTATALGERWPRRDCVNQLKELPARPFSRQITTGRSSYEAEEAMSMTLA